MSDISTKLTYLNTTKGKIKDSINLTGANIGNSDTFRSYSAKLRDSLVGVLNDGGKTLYNNFPKVTATGSSATLNSTYQAPMRVGLKGNTYQDSVPTPSSPQDIHVVTGNNTIKIENKNLFDKDNPNIVYSYFNSGNVVLQDNSTNYRTIYVECKPNTYYTVSKMQSARFSVGCTSSLPQQNVTVDNVITNNTATKITIQTNSNAKYLVAFVYHASYDTSIDADTLLESVQIEKGSTATSYVEHQEQNYPINLGTLELCKIGDYQDYIYKASGKWYKYGAIGKVVLDGEENWGKSANRFISGVIASVVKPTSSNNEVAKIFSDKFVGITINNTTQTSPLDGIAIAGSGNLVIYYDLVKNLTYQEFATWLTTNNVLLYYVLNEPTITEITDTTLIEQLNALEKAKSYTGVTNITAEYVNGNQPLMMDVSALLKEE